MPPTPGGPHNERTSQQLSWSAVALPEPARLQRGRNQQGGGTGHRACSQDPPAKILEALQRAHPAGLTSDEAGRHAGVTKYAARSRIAELQATIPPLVRDSNERRKNDLGLNAVVWIVTEEGAHHVG